MTVCFTVPGEPVGKGRPRVLKSGHVYTPPKTVEYEAEVMMYYRKQCNEHFGKVPLAVNIEAYFQIPKGANKTRKAMMICGDVLPAKKPDVDNIAKIMLDALNGVAYDDDAQVVRCHISKDYAETPRVEVCISELEGELPF